MPAIRIEHLNQQIDRVIADFKYPDRCIRNIIDLCEYYSNRIRKHGQSGEPKPIINQFNIPKPVLRQLIQALPSIASEHPAQTIILIDKLWNKQIFEFQLIACSLLGTLPIENEAHVIQTINIWMEKNIDRQVEIAISEVGLSNIREYAPSQLLSYIEKWLNIDDMKQKRLALLALLPIIKNQKKDFLPAIYSMIKPYIRNIPDTIKFDVLNVIETLSERSPLETAFLLKSNLKLFNKYHTAWLIRQSIHHFPNNIQEELRSELRLIKTLA